MQAVAQFLPALRGGQQIAQKMRDRFKPFAQRRGIERIQRLVGEIDRGFDLHPHRQQLRRERVHPTREFAFQCTPRRARRAHVAGGDQVGDRFGLGEIELAVAERTFAVFARSRHPCAEFATACEQLLQQDRAAVGLQFDHVLAGVAGGCGEIQRDAIIDGVATAFAEACMLRMARTQAAIAHRFGDGVRTRAGQPHDANAAGTGRGSNRGDGVVVAS